jgi:hypothetical protein
MHKEKNISLYTKSGRFPGFSDEVDCDQFEAYVLKALQKYFHETAFSLKEK